MEASAEFAPPDAKGLHATTFKPASRPTQSLCDATPRAARAEGRALPIAPPRNSDAAPLTLSSFAMPVRVGQEPHSLVGSAVPARAEPGAKPARWAYAAGAEAAEPMRQPAPAAAARLDRTVTQNRIAGVRPTPVRLPQSSREFMPHPVAGPSPLEGGDAESHQTEALFPQALAKSAAHLTVQPAVKESQKAEPGQDPARLPLSSVMPAPQQAALPRQRIPVQTGKPSGSTACVRPRDGYGTAGGAPPLPPDAKPAQTADPQPPLHPASLPAVNPAPGPVAAPPLALTASPVTTSSPEAPSGQLVPQAAVFRPAAASDPGEPAFSAHLWRAIPDGDVAADFATKTPEVLTPPEPVRQSAAQAIRIASLPPQVEAAPRHSSSPPPAHAPAQRPEGQLSQGASHGDRSPKQDIATGANEEIAGAASKPPAEPEKRAAQPAGTGRKSTGPADSIAAWQPAASSSAPPPEGVLNPYTDRAGARPAPSPEPHDPGGAAQPAAANAVPPRAPASSASNFQVQVSEGGQRVQLRVVERGGELRVAVHTPDSRLAGALREDLPALTARLQESGFHGEAWHGAEPSAAERTRWTEGAPHSGNEQSSKQSGQDQQDRPPEQRQPKAKPLENAGNNKSDRKDFTWLFTSIT